MRLAGVRMQLMMMAMLVVVVWWWMLVGIVMNAGGGGRRRRCRRMMVMMELMLWVLLLRLQMMCGRMVHARMVSIGQRVRRTRIGQAVVAAARRRDGSHHRSIGQ